MTPNADPHPVLADTIVVTRAPGAPETISLVINGEPFPFLFLADVGAKVSVGVNDAPGVTITIPARLVQVVDRVFETYDENSHGYEAGGSDAADETVVGEVVDEAEPWASSHAN